ncbi:hypothetical protein CIPAW_16G078100 [Carya illinoinensis]|uniref:RRM domain-containing protein n=1 Tax=Carya illinoinensis TaxID=32201 RepID=A0A8T1N552_CARIL|nr:hypothetical protein CIPAW_16G078100 [Carya illinoinensis]KAG6625174.1 hypothetical protein CIPAW_16G078100 [Carya illinoinensis]
MKSAILMILRVREPLLGAKNCTQFNDPKVHFAATKGALALYFAKCGSVVNMVILTDEATSRRKGSAYVTFVSKESVEKALELSGSQFSSRTIKLRLKMLQEG